MKEKTITLDQLVRWVGVGLLVLGILLLVNYLSSVLLPFFVAWLLAYLLYPMVKFVQYKLHVGNRALSIVITLVFVIALLGGVIYLIIPPMIEQFEKLGSLATDYIQKEAHIRDIPSAIQDWINQNNREIEKFFKSSTFTDSVKTVLPGLFNVLGQTATIIIGIVASLITLLYMFFILLDYEFWQGLGKDAGQALNNYVRGQGTVALIMGILFCIGFTIIDFPMAIGLGIMIGLMDLVPYLHTFALIPTVLLALLKSADTGQNFWVILIMALAVFIIVQLICDMIVTPKVMGKAMGLNPAILLLSLSVWGALLGFIGLIIALPLTTLLIAYYEQYVTKDKEIEALGENNSE